MIYLDAATFRLLLGPGTPGKLAFMGRVELTLGGDDPGCTSSLVLLELLSDARRASCPRFMGELEPLVRALCPRILPLEAEAVFALARDEPTGTGYRELEWALARRAGATKILSPDPRWGRLAGPDAVC